MDSFKVTFLCLLINLPTIAGLWCFKCTDFFVETDNQAAKNLFKLRGLTETPGCRAPVDNRTTTLPIERCSVAPSGKINACELRIVSATVFGSSGGGEVTATFRGCGVIPESKTDTCYNSGIQGVANIEGVACYCSTDKCYGETNLSALSQFFS